MFLLTPARARGTCISFRVRHGHRVFHRQAKGARVWVEVEGRVYRLRLRGLRVVSTPLLRRLRQQISKCFKVRLYSFYCGQGCYLT